MRITEKLTKPASVLKTESSWHIKKYSSSLPPEVTLDNSSTYHCVPEVQDLVQELAKGSWIKRVRAVAPRAGDIHWIEFELELQPNDELSDESWDQIEDLVIDCEWDMRRKTKEKWYFHAEVVENFVKVREGAKVVAASYIQSLEAGKSTKSTLLSNEQKSQIYWSRLS